MWDWIMEKIYGAKYYYDKANKTVRTGRVHDYLNRGWGHDVFSFFTTKTASGLKTPLILMFTGFGHITAGDIITAKVDGEVKQLLILEVEYETDPSDMFKALGFQFEDYKGV
jgi:hypothetical protein